MRRLRVALAQINTTVGDLAGNARLIAGAIARARDLGADVVAVPELALTGYPPEDLLLRRSFVEENIQVLHEQVVPASAGIAAVVGFVDLDDDIYNAAAVIHDGRLVARYHKQFLPNYGVFDEERYFQHGSRSPVFRIAGVNVAVNICEDIWYTDGPTRAQSRAGAEVVININGSPYHRGKGHERERMIATRASDNAVIICYVNQVGGQDELVFDGHSFICDERGRLVARAPQFVEHLLVADVDVESVWQTRLHDPRYRKERRQQRDDPHTTTISITQERTDEVARDVVVPSVNPTLEPLAETYDALVLGVRDYMRKTGFETGVVGLSGGVDSALVATVAADALGATNVMGVSMPSRFSSEHSQADAALLAEHLGIKHMTLPIEAPFQAYLDVLAGPFADTQFGTAEENLQARVRGNLLMALSNKFGWLVLTTGNKSELATGYATLYGDMAGGFAVLKDVPKTLVWELSRHRNARAGTDLIPQRIIDKPPSAELRPDQLDTDTLPPYDILDPILEAYVEQDRSPEEIVALGYDEATVRRIVRLVDANEYKRRQAPPGIKITPRAFGRDRRLPIATRPQPDQS